MQEGDELEVCDGSGRIVQAVMGAAPSTKSATTYVSSELQKVRSLDNKFCISRKKNIGTVLQL